MNCQFSPLPPFTCAMDLQKYPPATNSPIQTQRKRKKKKEEEKRPSWSYENEWKKNLSQKCPCWAALSRSGIRKFCTTLLSQLGKKNGTAIGCLEHVGQKINSILWLWMQLFAWKLAFVCGFLQINRSRPQSKAFALLISKRAKISGLPLQSKPSGTSTWNI